MMTFRASQMTQVVKNLPAMQEKQEMQVLSLDQGGPLEKEMVIHSSIVAWKIPWTEESDDLQSTGLQKVRHNSVTNMHKMIAFIF